MTFYDPAESDELLVAKAESAPLSVLAEIVIHYRNSIRAHLGAIEPVGASKRFERAVLARNDVFLNLMLAGAASDEYVVYRLWEFSENGAASETYRRQLQAELLEGPALRELMVERCWGGPREAKFSLAELLSGDNYPVMRRVIANPYCSNFFREILRGEGEFSSIPFKNMARIFYMMSTNPKVNDGWLDHEFESTIRDAPVSAQWFDALYAVVTNIERDKFGFHRTSIREFCQKWLGYKFEDIAEIVGRGGGSLPGKGKYTSLNHIEEFVSIFCAKFGRLLMLQGTPLGVPQLATNAMLSSDDFLFKSACLGNAKFTTAELAEVLQSTADINIYFWLIFNDSVMLNPASRLLLREAVTIEQLSAFKSRCQYLEAKEPDSFWIERVVKKNASLPEKIARDFSRVPEKIALVEARISEVERLVRVIVCLTIVTLILSIFAASK